ncbi:discoidin domain-containing protein [Streptomyces sp. TRM49041]|uniref:discoidin domain-containing protein n=1 Tax=Streptomyces sp. TRM49041 TaxID=2603216 RepID=UPI0011EDAF74|nr:discoidin domain-containing protein [Streptomyces sp. TRM49041]
MATATEPPLLSYALEPKSIAVSTPTKPKPGKLGIVAIADTDVYCDGIIIKIPIGTGEEDLTTDKTITARLESDNESVPDAWPYEEKLEADGSVLAVEFTPNAAVRIPAGTTLTLHIADFDINEEVGTAQITITELTSPTSGGPYPPRTTSREVKKTPPGFYLSNFTPDHIAVDNGDSVVLTWDTSGGTNYRMYWDDLSEPLSTDDTAWRSPALTRTTGFMLQASVNTRSGRSLILHTLTTAVTVTNQDIAARDIAVNGTLDIGNGPGTATTHPSLGFADLDGTRHLPSAMTDGSRNTYWRSAGLGHVNSWVQIDLGSERDITMVDMYLGAPDGLFDLNTCVLESSTNGTSWSTYASIAAYAKEYHGTIARTARYMRLKLTAGRSTPIAIRSFEITTTPRGATITPDGAIIYGPVQIQGDLLVGGTVISAGGVTAPTLRTKTITSLANVPLTIENNPTLNPANKVKLELGYGTIKADGEIVATDGLKADGEIVANGGVAIPSMKPLVVDTIQIPDPAGARKQVVFNSPVWIQEVPLPAGTPAHLTVRGSVDVSGALNAKGKLAAVGDVEFTGSVQGYRSTYARSWAQGTVPKIGNPYTATAPTDGVLYGHILCYDNTAYNDNIGYKGSLFFIVAGQAYRCDAPILRQSGAGAQHYTVTAPVRKGDSIRVYLTHDTTSIWYSKLAAALLWRPFGLDAALTGFSRATLSAELPAFTEEFDRSGGDATADTLPDSE